MNSRDLDLEALFNRLADGIASEADKENLGTLLRSRPQARRAYREFMAMHSALHWDYVATAASQPSQGSAPDGLTEVLTEERVRRADRARSLLIATAAALLIAMGWFVASQLWIGNPSVAVLESTSDCIWEAEPLSVGNPLHAGQTLRLKTGVAKIQFASGATVILQGPTTLRLDSARQARLQNGTLSAWFPRQRSGSRSMLRASRWSI